MWTKSALSCHSQVRGSECLHLSSDLQQNAGYPLSLEAFEGGPGADGPGLIATDEITMTFLKTTKTFCFQFPSAPSRLDCIPLLKPLYHLNMWNYEVNSMENIVFHRRLCLSSGCTFFSCIFVYGGLCRHIFDCLIERAIDLRRIYFTQSLQSLFFPKALIKLRSQEWRD